MISRLQNRKSLSWQSLVCPLHMARILLINIQQFETNLTVGYIGTESVTSHTDDRKIQQYIMYTNKSKAYSHLLLRFCLFRHTPTQKHNMYTQRP